ncbi:MAG: spondin domain-containing protein, partial [Planctomycetota bacterium]
REPTVTVAIENTLAEDGFFFTPMWVAAHDGRFDVWSGGRFAEEFPGLEELAEEGDTGPISAAFSASASGLAGGRQATITAMDMAPPVFSPQEQAMFQLPVGDPRLNRYFSYATMIIPSNDLFAAVSVPTTHELFDENGEFTGPFTIEIFGRDIVDAGTEVNNINGGAAFSANGGEGAEERNPLADIFVLDPDANYLDSIVGTEAVTGAVIRNRFGPDDVVARIRVTLDEPVAFRRGDANLDTLTDISDVVTVLSATFLGGDLNCEKAADVNDSGVIDISDPIWLLNFLFLDGPRPPSPFGECGVDLTADELTCSETACPSAS